MDPHGRHLPDRPPAAGELRAFAWTVGAAFLALAALVAWRGRPAAAGALGALGAALLAAGLVAPGRLGPAHRAWMALAGAMSRVTTPLFMGVVYFALLTPLGIAVRLARRRGISPPRGAATYWAERPAGARRSDLRRQF